MEQTMMTTMSCFFRANQEGLECCRPIAHAGRELVIRALQGARSCSRYLCVHNRCKSHMRNSAHYLTIRALVETGCIRG